MIIVLDALNKDRLSHLLDEMFALRARVFGERLGWEVEIENGQERDVFDDLDPAYVIGLDEEGHVVSCVRALQTTGPHMLSDVFHDILGGEPPLRSPNLWESTRFCVDTDRLTRNGGGMTSVNKATCELMIGSLEYARMAGISDIVTVIDPVMNRVLKRSDCAPYDYVGNTVQMGKVKALAALLDTGEERVRRLRDYAGIDHDVFLTDEQALALAPAPAAEPLVSRDQLVRYCADQIIAAPSAKERRAAERLCETLLDGAEMERAIGMARKAALKPAL